LHLDPILLHINTTKSKLQEKPLSQWKNTDDAANSVSWVARSLGAGSGKTAQAANNTALFGNTTSTQSVANVVPGQFGADTTETTVSGKLAHAGWQLRRAGLGQLASIAISAGGTGYANTDTIAVTAKQGVNAAATLSTNSTGGITSVTITNNGGLFLGTETLTITTSGGSGATLVGTFGGRAGRVHYETLVAMGSLTGDAEDTIFPDS
jgi:hypothetical protein